jgi:hypothetical protein
MPRICRLATVPASLALASLFTIASCDPGEDTAQPEDVSQPLSFSNLTGQSQPFLFDSGTVCTIGGWTLHCCPGGMAMTGANLSQNRFKCALVTGGLTDRHLDGVLGPTKTARNNMHACPFGEVMVGYYRGTHALGYADEHLACAKPDPAVVKEQVDGNPPSSDGQMHICPEKAPDNTPIVDPGRLAMTGIHAGANLFTCGR